MKNSKLIENINKHENHQALGAPTNPLRIMSKITAILSH